MDTADVSRRSVFWSAYATVYDRIWDAPITRQLAGYVGSVIVDCPGTLVDLGCGTGLISRELGRDTVGIDTSPAMLRRAVDAIRVERVLCAPAELTPLQAGSAAVVLVCNVLHLHPDPRRVVEEARRLCAPGGVVVLTWPLPDADTSGMRRIDRATGRSAVGTWGAHVLRKAVGISGALSGAVAISALRAERAICQWSAEITHDVEFARCQRIVTMRPV